ncbi:MAG: aminoglycoside phosphotransferase family protein [Planctomycetota bacterium]
MKPDSDACARAAASRFAIDGELQGVVAHHRGHIHDTLISTWRTASGETRFLHQRMNEGVFGDVNALMRNIAAVSRHLGAGGEAADGLVPLELVPTRDGGNYLRADDGAWRCYRFIENAASLDRCDGPARAREAARAFGAFQARLADLPAGALTETIPQFFSGAARLAQLERATADDTAGRRAGCVAELAFVEARRTLITELERDVAAGVLPTRVVHGDTKLNNVLFDCDTGRAKCVVDLDTCMPAWSLYDFGDLVRFTAATCAEDEPDAAGRADIDLALYREIAAGYLESAGAFLTEAEVAAMPRAARWVTLVIGVRFLTDHLCGDRYFKVARPDHNLARARVQLAMVAAMERVAEAMVVG